MSRQSWWFPFTCGVWSLFVWSMWAAGHENRDPSERVVVGGLQIAGSQDPKSGTMMCALNPCIPFR